MKHFEPLTKMNPFRKMERHHLNYNSSGGVLLALSHEIDFCLRLFPELYGSLTAEFLEKKISLRVKKSCVVSSNVRDNNVPKVKIQLSYSDDAVPERTGKVDIENVIYSWDLNRKVIMMETPHEKHTKKFTFTSDELVKSMLVDFMGAGIDKQELLDRFDRATYITQI